MLVGVGLYICVQLLLALLAPVRLVYFCLLTSAFPLMWDVGQPLDTPIGRLDVLAIRVFGLSIAAAISLASNSAETVARVSRHKWHLAFLAFCALTIVYAPSTTYGIRMLVKLLGPLLFCLLVTIAIKSRAQLAWMQTAILTSGATIAVLAIGTRAFGFTSDPNSSISGISGLGPPGMGPPVFAAHMLSVAMLALATYVTEKKKWAGILAILFAICILGTLQRISIAALCVGFSAILFVSTKGFVRFLLPVTCLIAAPLLFLFNSTLRNRMFYGDASPEALLHDPSAALESLNGSGRFGLWDQVLERFFFPHPLQGSGLGATQDYLYGHSFSGIGVVHSEYIRLLSEVGLFGLGLFAATALTYLFACRHRFRTARERDVRKYSLAAFGALLSYLVYMTTDNGLDYVGQFGIFVFAMIAMSSKAHELSAFVSRSAVVIERAAGFHASNLMR